MGSCASLMSRNETSASAIVTTVGTADGNDDKDKVLRGVQPSSDDAGQATSEAVTDPNQPDQRSGDGMLRKDQIGGNDSAGGPSTSGRSEGSVHPPPSPSSALPPINKPSQLLSPLPPIMPQEPPGRMLGDVPLPYCSGFSVGDDGGDSMTAASFAPPHRHYHHHLMQDPAPSPPLQHAMPPRGSVPGVNRLPDIVRCTSPPTQRWGLPMQQQQQHTDAPEDTDPEERWDMQPERLTRPDDAQEFCGNPGETSEWDHNMIPPTHPSHPQHNHQQQHEQQQQQQQYEYEYDHQQQQHHNEQHHGDYYDEAAGYPNHEGGADGLDDSYGGPTSMGVLKDIIGLAHGDQQGGFQQGYGPGGGGGCPGGHQGAAGEEQHHPDADEIVQYARHLGMDLAKDADLLWIAEQALKAPMPAHWSCHYDEGSGNDYYYNEISGVTAWEHPLHEHFRALFLQMKEEKERSAIRDKLAGRRNKEQAQSEVKRAEKMQGGGGGARSRRREQPRESFISDLDDSRRFDDSNFTGTDVDSSLGNSLDMSRDMSRSRLSDTYNSLDMSLSNSEIGGLKLNLMGMINRAPNKTRGGGLGLELKQHSKEGSSRADRHGSRHRESSTKRSGKAVFARMLER